MSEFKELHVVKATFDPTATAAMRTEAAHGLGVYIPKNAIVTKVIYDVITVFTSTAGGTDKATVALMIKTADDVLAAIAIEAATNPLDAGIHTTIVGAPALYSFDAANNPTALEYATTILACPAYSMIKTDATYEVTATVGTCAVTGGKMNIYVEYVMSS